MKKILLLNGSPKGQKSNTLKLANAFVEGLNQSQEYEVEVVHLKEKNIKHCIGCFHCWTKTPGSCILQDDMDELLDQYLEGDIILWSYPLYYYGMPSIVKAYMDRLLPTNLPFIEIESEDACFHPQRYNTEHQKHILISTCGFYGKENNAEGLLKQFDIFTKGKGYTLMCPEGELFRVDALRHRTQEYLEYVKQGGVEYHTLGAVAEETQKHLDTLLYPPEEFVQMANLSWDINSEGEKLRQSVLKKGEEREGETPITSHDKPNRLEMSPGKRFLSQMAVSYNKSANPDATYLLEFEFTDLQENYQMEITPQGAKVLEEKRGAFTTKIITSFEVWKEISSGKLDGQQALFDKLYRTEGDLGLMIKMSDLFLGGRKNKEEKKDTRKSSMLWLILPYLPLWVFLPMNLSAIAFALALIFAGLIHILPKVKVTPYDKIGGFTIMLITAVALFLGNSVMMVCMTYFIFGLIWFLSAFTKIPLTAYYSNRSYGGEESAFKNPLFLRTNRIISVVWGLGYFIGAIVAFFVLFTPISTYTGLVNTFVPICAGIFTAIFSKKYPKYYAKK